MPNTGVPLCNSAISVPQIGNPAMKDWCRRSDPAPRHIRRPRARCRFLADDAVLGKVGLDQAAHHRFGGAVGLGDRIEIARALVVDGERGPEERQDGFAGRSRERPMKAVKSMTVTAVPYRNRGRILPRLLLNPHRRAPPTARYSHSYCDLAFESALKGFVKRGFLVSRAITKLRVLAYQHCSEERGLAELP